MTVPRRKQVTDKQIRTAFEKARKADSRVNNFEAYKRKYLEVIHAGRTEK